MAAEAPSGPLNGIRVIDLATARGEVAGRVLADLGAEVVKVEPPSGTPSRSMPPFASVGTDGGPRSLFWATAGAGKRSVVLDVQSPTGRDRLVSLAATADVIIESFDPGEMDGLGLGFAQLRAVNPRLIYVSITPFGQTGPRATEPATDITLQAAGGLVSLQGDWDRRPIPVGEPYTATYHAGAQAAADTVIALNERDRSGLGQHLDVSMQLAIVWILMNATGFPPNEGRDPPGYGDDRGLHPVSAAAMALQRVGITVHLPNLWECADGYAYALIIPSPQRADSMIATLRWADEVGVLDTDRDLLEVAWDTFLDDVGAGRADQELLQRAMEGVRRLFQRVTKRQIMERSIKDNLFFAPIYTTHDLLHDPHLVARGFWQTIDGVTHPGPFARLSETPITAAAGAPALGRDQSLLEGLGEPASAASAPASASGPAAGAGLRPRPFEGLKVVDFAWVGVGPIVSKSLADHGATVVHVESATRLDTLRGAPPFKGGVQDPDLSQFFANFNSSKLGIALNLRTTEGQRVARRLIDWADVIVESFTPGTMAKLGLDYATVSQGRTDLIMLSTCLRGQTGPEADLAGFGTSGAGLSGLHSVTGWPDRAPSGPWGAYTDFITPRLAISALTATIHHRRRTGRGQRLDISQIECGINFMAPEVLNYTVNGVTAAASGDSSPFASPNGTYQVEGAARYIALSVETPEQWRALRSIALEGKFAEASYDEIENRRRSAEPIEQALREWLRGQTASSALGRLIEARVPASLVARPSDLYLDPQIKHRGFFTELDHTRMGLTPYDGFVTQFSAIPSGPRAAAPCLGEHTTHVLTELLGMSADEVVALEKSGVLR